MRHDTMIGSICCELASQARASACTGLATAKDNVVGYSSKSVRIPNGHHLPGNMQTSGVPKSTEQLERRALPWAPLFFFALFSGAGARMSREAVPPGGRTMVGALVEGDGPVLERGAANTPKKAVAVKY